MVSVKSQKPRTFMIVVALGLTIASLVGTAGPAAGHSDSSWVYVYNVFADDDGVHDDVSAYWAHNWGTSPPGHTCVYVNWGYPADWCMDIFARVSGRRFVTPFGSKTNTGHSVESRVVAIAPACASGNIADGGYRVTIEAKDLATGAILGRAVLAHVANEQVFVSQVLGGWTTIGWSSRFKYSSCYQVTSDWGIHGHVEFTNLHAYAAYAPMSYQQPLTELTKIGIVGAHYGGRRAAW